MRPRNRTRILFADDQIPVLDEEKNERFKQELRKELSSKFEDFETAYQEDNKWFGELIGYLQIDKGFEVTIAKSFSTARNLVEQRDDYDVAVIDLSWTGDPDVPPDKKKNAGLELLRLVAEENETTGVTKPTLAFSQNYEQDPEVLASVLEADSIPIPKHYSKAGQRSLAAAIILVVNRVDRSGNTSNLKTMGDVVDMVQNLSPAIVWQIVVGMFAVLSAVATVAYWLGTQLA